MLNDILEGFFLKRFDSKVIVVRVQFSWKQILSYSSPLNMTGYKITDHIIVGKMSIAYDNIIDKGTIE